MSHANTASVASIERVWRKKVEPIFWGLVVLLVAVVVVFPLYWMVLTALEPPTMIYDYPPHFVPPQLAIGSFLAIFQTSQLMLWLENSLLVAVTSTVVAVLLSAFAAYSLSRFTFSGRLFLALAVLVTQMLPGTLFVVPLYQIFLQAHLVNTLIGIIIAHSTFSIPVAIWMLKGFFDVIPRELEEAAYIDGCTRTGAFFRVVVPLSLPGFTVAAIFSFINSWNEYLFARTFLADSSRFTVSVGLSTFIQQYNISWDQVMAGAAISTLPVVLCYLLLQRYLIQGLTAGAVKG